jgi:hypothetical protein
MLEKDKTVTEALDAQEDAREADAVSHHLNAERKKAETETDGLRLELDGARLREHNSKERDAPVERSCDLGTQCFRALEDLFNSRLAVENALLKSESEESREVLESTKLRDATYQESLAASKKLLETCNADNGLIGRVHQRNEATKACAGRLFQLLGESVGEITAMNQPHVVETPLLVSLDDDEDEAFPCKMMINPCNLLTAKGHANAPSQTKTRVVERVSSLISLHDTWVASKLAQVQDLSVNVKEAITKLDVLLKAEKQGNAG